MMTLKTLFAAGIAISLGASAASAGQVTYTSNVVPLTTTSFTGTPLTLQQFDPTLGTLTGVWVHLFGNILGSVHAQNQSAEAASVTLNLSATLTLNRPDSTSIVVTTPVVTKTANLNAFTNVNNYNGPDAIVFENVAATADNTAVLNSTDFSLFTGTGFVNGTLDGTGSSAATGPGNLLALFQTEAGGYAMVTYTFSSVPEPAAIALLGLGMGVIGLARRRAK